MLEDICDPNSERGEWITKVDIRGTTGELVLDVMDNYSECKSNECKAVTRVCEDVKSTVGEGEIAAKVYRGHYMKSPEEFSQAICGKMSKFCPAKPLNGKRIDEKFVPLDDKVRNSKAKPPHCCSPRCDEGKVDSVHTSDGCKYQPSKALTVQSLVACSGFMSECLSMVKSEAPGGKAAEADEEHGHGWPGKFACSHTYTLVLDKKHVHIRSFSTKYTYTYARSRQKTRTHTLVLTCETRTHYARSHIRSFSLAK